MLMFVALHALLQSRRMYRGYLSHGVVVTEEPFINVKTLSFASLMAGTVQYISCLSISWIIRDIASDINICA